MKKFLPTSILSLRFMVHGKNKKTLNHKLITKNSFGFTLVELLVVITILAILMTIGIAVYSGVQKNARDIRRKNDLRSIKIALELYYQTHGKYPPPATGGDAYRHSSGTQPWIPELTTDYMSGGVPTDVYNTGSGFPWSTDGKTYRYAYTSNSGICGSYQPGQYFILAAQLENKSDGENIANKNTKFCDGLSLVTQYNWSGSAYVLSSQ